MQSHQSNQRLIRWLTYLMFMMFAMTTDAVGVIIPQIIEQYDLSLTAAGAFHYAPMIAIAISGIGLGFLADLFGRKKTIIAGLALFAVACAFFSIGNSFYFFLSLLVVSGFAIGIFKTAALALVGDISPNSQEHTKTMNLVEGFFAIGAIVGPAIVTYLLAENVSWTYLYLIAGGLCVILCLTALAVKYPDYQPSADSKVSFAQTLTIAKQPEALGFSFLIACYVAAEAAIYVWMPAWLHSYEGNLVFLATWALSLFFILRAVGRFMAVWLLNLIPWDLALVLLSGAIFACYLSSVLIGVDAAVVLLPLSGLFMAMIYPTLNSKGISCFPRHQHGAIAGVILFFTAVAAAIGPLLMGVVSDLMGSHPKYGFIVACAFAAFLFIGLVYNYIRKPAHARLLQHQ